MMKTLVLTIAFSTILSSPAYTQPRHPIGFDDLMSMRRVGAPQLSPDGKTIAYDVSTMDVLANKRRSAIFTIPASGGTVSRITEGKTQDENPVWSPDGKNIAFVSNSEGGAKQVFLYDVAAGKSRRISSLPSGAGSLMWAPDGSGLIAVSDIYVECGAEPDCNTKMTDTEEKNPVKARVITSLLYRHWNAFQPSTRSHILFVPLSGGVRDLTPGKFDAPPFSLGGGQNFDISPDGRELAFTSNTDVDAATSTNNDLFIVPLKGGEAKRITTRRGADEDPSYSPDGKWLAYRSQSRAGYESDIWELWLYDRASGKSTRVAQDFANWIGSLTWSPDSKAIIFTAQENADTAIYELAVPSGRAKSIFKSGSADAVTLSRDGKTIFFERATLSRPPEIFSIARAGRSTPRQITHENDALFTTLDLGETGEMWYEGAGGTRVHALTVKPPRFDASKRYPALVLIHGGPQGAWTNSWSYRWNAQMFASRGYVVFMPNPRGSTGYGQQFTEDISGDWGGKVYTDIMNGVDKLVALPYVDGSRLAAAGGSYGGYMVNWILGHNDRFKALVSHAGVYNLESMAGVTEELWFTDWEFKGNPWDNPELYEKWSPHKFVKNFKTPTLVVHGELDYRVPVGEGMQLFTALQRRGVPSKFLYYPDEGHWILKPQNSRLWYDTVLGWFDQYLKK